MATKSVLAIGIVLLLSAAAFVYFDPLDLELLPLQDEPPSDKDDTNGNHDDNNDKNNQDDGSDLIPAEHREIAFYELAYDITTPFIELQARKQGVNVTAWRISNLTGDGIHLPILDLMDEGQVLTVFPNQSSNSTSKKNGAIILNTTSSFSLGTTGEMLLSDATNKTIDYLRWGGSPQTWKITNFWSSSDHGISSQTGESIQLLGLFLNSSSQWRSIRPTPSQINSLPGYNPSFQISYVLTNEYNRSTSTAEEILPDVTRTEVTLTPSGVQPVSVELIETLHDFINKTLDFYEDNGFNPPQTTPSGDIEITIVNDTSIEGIAGGARSDGTIRITIGENFTKIDLKVAIEHEIMHLVQFKSFSENGKTYIRIAKPLSENVWWLEGMAEFWGIRSAMDQFGLNYTQVKNASRNGGGPNWWDHARRLNTSIFSDWYGHSGWDRYEMAFQFMKFMFEEYGNKTIKDISSCLRYNTGSRTTEKDVSQCIKEITGKSQDEIMAEFYLWKVFDRQDGDIPAVLPDNNITISDVISSNSSILEIAPEGGARLNVYHMNSSGMVTINMTSSNGKNWTFVVVQTARTGGNESFVVYNQSSFQLQIDANSYSNITIIKINQRGNPTDSLNVTVTVVSTNFAYEIENGLIYFRVPPTLMILKPKVN